MSLVNESKIYKGTNTATQTVGLTNNTTTVATTVQTDKTTSLNKSAVTIKTGTQFKDAVGTILTGTDVNVEVTNTDAAGESLRYTGNLTFKDINGAEVTDKIIEFYAGTTSINMNVGGTSVKAFNNAISVAIEIQSTATSPSTGDLVKLGDEFPIYTNEDDSTVWAYHGLGTIVAGDTGETFNINFETTHLSNFATVKKFEDRACSSTPTYNLTATNLPETFSGFLEVELKALGTHRPMENFIFSAQNVFSVWIINGKITWWTIGEGKIFQGYQGSNYGKTYIEGFEKISTLINSGLDYNDYRIPSAGQNIRRQLFVKLNGVQKRDNISDIATVANCELAINFSRDLVPNIESLKTINVDFAGNCNGKTFIPDGFPLYVLRENGQFSYEGTIRNGKMALNGFELNKEYIFKTVYKGESLLHKWTFDSENFVDHNFKISKAVCDAIGL
ncbi:MAG: hypothetical protein V3V28_13125 [Polaribacter sp.]|uniref:hypothetical protein n=1 Tax=Polaribacter sp. TaxID=1920175 RepID=UPI002F3596DE